MKAPQFTPLVEKLPATVPFVGPETQERARGKPFDARIGANESVFGPSPNTISAMEEALQDIWKYCDPENHDLKQALAVHHGVKPGNIVVGEGIDGLQNVLVRMLVGEDVPVVTSLGAYPTFNFHVASVGGTLHTVPFRDDREDPLALLEKAKDTGAPLFYLSNPDNPMGSCHDASSIQALIDAVPDATLLCLDEAYIEFGDPEVTTSSQGNSLAPRIDVSNRNVIRFRTFSKAYGMAGARIGYGIAHEDLALSFNKIRNHFGVNRIAQIGALAALQDQEYLAKVVNQARQSCAQISAIASDNGLKPLPTAANFVAIDCGKDSEYARAVMDGLVERGIFVRMPFAPPQNRCIRVSAGTAQDLAHFAKALPEVLKNLQ